MYQKLLRIAFMFTLTEQGWLFFVTRKLIMSL